MRHVLILFSLLFASIARAQFDVASMARMASTPTMAMLRKDVRKEIKLTGPQTSEIDKIEKDMSASMNQRRGANPTDPTMGAEKLHESDAKILAVLDDPQKKRLTEIRVQMEGTSSLVDPEFAPALALSSDQTSKINGLLSDCFNDVVNQMRSHDKKTADKIDKMKADCETKALQVLTDAQRDKYKEIQGAPFKDARPKGSLF